MLEEYRAPFLQFLREKRYSASTRSTCRTVTQEFTIYLEGRVRSAEEISIDHLRGYLGIRAKILAEFWKRPTLPSYQRRLAAGLNLFLRYLAVRGIRTAVPFWKKQDLHALPTVPGYEELLAEYERFLRDHRGLRPQTLKGYVARAARLCRAMIESRTEGWDNLTPEALYDHLRSQTRTLGPVSLGKAQIALRSFFRFLRITGKCLKELDLYLIPYRIYTLARVPRIVSLDDLYRLFADVQGDSRAKIRDRAVLLLLTLYGLRIGEVARLQMEDVAWREEKFFVRRRKAGKDLVLPLHPAVARALWEYVEKVRPPGTPYREIFLSTRRWRPYLQGRDLGSTLRLRFLRLGLRLHPHAFRHALASHLINNDCPPEWIQALLGHARFASTQIYAKVDLTHLREVAENDGMAP